MSTIILLVFMFFKTKYFQFINYYLHQFNTYFIMSIVSFKLIVLCLMYNNIQHIMYGTIICVYYYFEISIAVMSIIIWIIMY